MAPGRLTVEVMASVDDGSAAATVRIEPLNQGKPGQSQSAPPVSRAKKKSTGSLSDLTSLRLLGHITGIGDKTVSAGEWLAGPSAPSRIEGIAIDWADQPDDLEIQYAVKTASRSRFLDGQSVSARSLEREAKRCQSSA
jgi:hypothetical protein